MIRYKTFTKREIAIKSKTAKTVFFGIMIIMLFAACASDSGNIIRDDEVILKDMQQLLQHNLLDSWYPRVIDTTNGGFSTRYDYKWNLISPFPKVIVTQTRGVWAASKAAMRYRDEKKFRIAARHGYQFLRDQAWDSEYGGFYQTTPVRKPPGPDDHKTAYGHAFAIYALSAYHELTGSKEALKLAKTAFDWLDHHYHDAQYGGYFNYADRRGVSFNNKQQFDLSGAPEESRAFSTYKDYNSSIHLMEAFSALYTQWPDARVRERLNEIFTIVRDTMFTSPGYLNMYFTENWQHVSFKDSSRKFIMEHSWDDHVSFGHDMETAFLLLEAEAVLGRPSWDKTLNIARRLVDHSLQHGFDDNSGIYYEGYYFKGDSTITIINPDKQWWVQAEGLNALLMMSILFPENPHYKEMFYKLWNFTKTYQIDHKYGGWYRSALDIHPRRSKRASKAGPWKGCYHNYRSLAQCVDMLETGSIPFLHQK
ncbi:MAG: AGE family epimerase/isomerase [candidate division KSB1 bacterium]|nr:AGE family epimerase/isomerase [candidate division KSB1 bacterium]